jgi:hypothetical protein
MTRRISVMVAGAILTPLFVVPAQSISGVVREAASGVAIPGAVVSLSGIGGGAITQTIANREGRYTIAVTPQAQRMVVRRIGFKPFEMALPDSVRAVRVTLDVAMQLVPRTLDPIASTGEGCRPSKTVAQGLALWEQARSAFLATVVARAAAPAKLLSLDYRLDAPERSRVVNASGGARTMTEGVRSITWVRQARVEQLTTNRPVVAGRTPAEFAARGYVELTGLLPDLYGPDADVLLDPAFEKGHCFSLAEQDGKRPGQVGVAFEPSIARQGVSDIKGVLWMDQSPLAVRGLEFIYVGHGAALKDRSGGRLSFRTADNGVVLVEEWELHYPAETKAGSSTTSDRDPVTGMLTTRVLSSTTTERLHIVGGSLIAANWPDGTTFKREHPSIGGKVVDEKTKQPVIGAYATLETTGYAAVSAADGSFHFSPLMPGWYSVRVADSTWARYGVERVGIGYASAFTPGKPSFPDDPIKLPPALDVAKAACSTSSLDKGKGIVAVRAVDTMGKTMDALFEFTWTGTDGKSTAQKTTKTRTGAVRRGHDALVPRSGVVVCGIGAGALKIAVSATNGASGSIELRPTGAAGLDTLTIVVRR